MRHDWDIVDPTHNSVLDERFLLADWPTATVRVGILDDQAISALSLQLLLESIPGVTVVMLASHTPQGRQSLMSLSPDVVFFNGNTHTSEALTMVEMFRHQCPTTKLIIIVPVVPVAVRNTALSVSHLGVFDAVLSNGYELAEIKQTMDSVLSKQGVGEAPVSLSLTPIVRKVG